MVLKNLAAEGVETQALGLTGRTAKKARRL
jgi:hypothetical protein